MNDWLAEVLTEVRSTLWLEVHDLIDVSSLTQLTVRLMMAALLGGLIGYERERSGKAAGIRTHMLVAIGSALFLVIPQQLGMTLDSMARILQGLIAGIGFLGAGTILKNQHEQEILGLTTAAALWMTAAIGCTCGLGRGGSALVAAFLTWTILDFLPRLVGRNSPHKAESSPHKAES
ncbi:MAG: MgtC/SapB family protein [Pirellulaceae bacterium]